MALENYRITEFQEKTQVDNGDYVLIDSATDGTHKYQLARIPAQASAEVAAAVAAEETAREAADAAEVTARNAAISAAISDEVTARNAAIAANVDDTLTVSGKAADAKKTGDEITSIKSDLTELDGAVEAIEEALETKAEIDGNYESMTVGNANQLLSDDYLIDKEPYQFRTTGGANDVGDREYDTLVGGTVAWNQLVQNGNFADSSSWGGSNRTFTVSNNVATITASAQSGGITQPFSFKESHKYYACADINLSSAVGYVGIVIDSVRTSKYAQLVTGWQRLGLIYGATTDRNNYIRIEDDNTSGWVSFDVKNVMFIDLTAMFGSTIADYIYSLEQATAGAGVALFRSLFPNDYYEYDAGSLKSVEGVSAHVTTGFNQWDEEWEVGGYAGATGNPWESNTRIRSKTTNYISVFPDTTYYVCMPSGTGMYLDIMFYDADKTFISTTNPSANQTFTTPSNVRFMRFATSAYYGTTYHNDICINLSWSGYRNGEYEPYWKRSYPLDSTLTLRGIPKLDASNHLYYDGDTYESDGTVTRRYGAYLFDGSSDESWSLQGINDAGIANFYITVSSYKRVSSWICNNASFPLQETPIAQTTTEGYLPSNNTTLYVRIASSKASTVAGFKTWLATNNLEFVYELATPTTEEADPFASPQICDDFGTEEYITTSIIPVGHDTKYIPNLRDKLRHLPEPTGTNGNYIIKETGEKLSLIPLPAEVPAPPTTDGTYVLKATVSSGVATLTWVSE